MSLVPWLGVRPVSRSIMFSLSLRMFSACSPDQMPSMSKDNPKHKKWRDQIAESQRLQRLEDPLKVREQGRKRNVKFYHGNLDHNRQRHLMWSQTPHAIARRTAYQQRPECKQREALRKFIIRRPHVWKHMTWKTHTPVMYEHKANHRCATCNTYPHLGFNLWWKRHDSSDSSSDLYECHNCFIADWSRAMPIGYEDFVFGQGKRLRLSNTPEATASPSDPKRKEP